MKGNKLSKRVIKNNLVAYSFIIVSLVTLLVLVYVPMISTVDYSFRRIGMVGFGDEWVGLGAVMVLDIRFLNAMGDSSTAAAMKTAVEILGVLGLMVLQYLFPGLARFEASTGNTLKNACLLAVGNLPKTLLLSGAAVGAVYLSCWSNLTISVAIVVWVLMGFALMAYGNSGVLVKIFDNCLPGNKNET